MKMESGVKTMKKSSIMTVLAVLALAAATTSVVAARGLENRTSAAFRAAKCVPTADGKFQCNATGEIMDAPCCVKSCCARK